MGIRFACPNGHPLHVKEFLAGKRGICPSCGAKFVIPSAADSVAAAQSQAKVSASRSPSADTISESEKASIIIPLADVPRAPAASPPVTPRPAVQTTLTVEAAPVVEPTPTVATGTECSISPAIKYVADRERARRNRTKIAVLLLIAVIALAAVLVWILTAGPPTIGGDTEPPSTKLQPTTRSTIHALANVAIFHSPPSIGAEHEF